MFIVLKIKIGNKQKILLPITDLYTINVLINSNPWFILDFDFSSGAKSWP